MARPCACPCGVAGRVITCGDPAVSLCPYCKLCPTGAKSRSDDCQTVRSGGPLERQRVAHHDFQRHRWVGREEGRQARRQNQSREPGIDVCSEPSRGEADEPATSVAARAKTSSLKPRDLHEWCDVAIIYCSLPEFPAQLCSLYTPWTISPGCTRCRQPPFGVRSDTHKRFRARTGCCRKQARSAPRSC
jgi:hypothetical protein